MFYPLKNKYFEPAVIVVIGLWYTGCMSRDFQRRRVYTWCALYASADCYGMGSECDYDTCVDLVNRCCSLYGVRSCGVEFSGPKRYSSYHNSSRGTYISLSPGMRRIDVVVHEVAHHIVACLYPGASDHGPVFVRVMMCLLTRLCGVHLPFLYECARYCGVRYAGLSYSAP